jgi:fumarate reductase subunit D
MAVILAVATVVLLGIAAFVGPDAPSTALRVVFLAASWSGPVVLLMLVALIVSGADGRHGCGG